MFICSLLYNTVCVALGKRSHTLVSVKIYCSDYNSDTPFPRILLSFVLQEVHMPTGLKSLLLSQQSCAVLPVTETLSVHVVTVESSPVQIQQRYRPQSTCTCLDCTLCLNPTSSLKPVAYHQALISTPLRLIIKIWLLSFRTTQVSFNLCSMLGGELWMPISDVHQRRTAKVDLC